MKNILLIPYAPNLIESTRSIGYSFETALADIIDNSISNSASRIDVKFMSDGSPYVAVIDDGVGMSEKYLEDAMRYGSNSALDERSNTDLGRFGLGLKMASMSQCRKLTVLTKHKGKLAAACWDLDHIYETKEWSLIMYSKDELKKLRFFNDINEMTSGTIVLWEKLDRISKSETNFHHDFNETLSLADKHLSLVFHRYLENKLMKSHIEIYFNNRPLEPIDPFMISNRATQELEDETLFIDKIPIKIKPYIIPYASKLSAKERQIQSQFKDLNLNQGLYIYRNMRLIVWGKWFYLLHDNELNRLARIKIDLPNSIDDYWTIDVKKSTASIPSSLKQPLKQIILRTVGKSEKVYRYRGRKSNQDHLDHVWNKVENREKIQYLVNRDFPIYKALEKILSEEQNMLLNSFIKSLEDSFPYGDVYFELAKSREFEQKTQSVDEVYMVAKQTIEILAGNKEAQKSLIKSLKLTDMFMKYPEVITMLEKELDE